MVKLKEFKVPVVMNYAWVENKHLVKGRRGVLKFKFCDPEKGQQYQKFVNRTKMSSVRVGEESHLSLITFE